MGSYILFYFKGEGSEVKALGFNRYMSAQEKYKELESKGYTCLIVDTQMWRW